MYRLTSMMNFQDTTRYFSMIAACSVLLVIIYWYHARVYRYWKTKGVPYLKPEFFFGNTKDLMFMRTSFAEMFQSLYFKLEGNKLAGVFSMQKPILLVRDPELIKNFMTKDFSHFQDRTSIVDKTNPLSQHLFNLKGIIWRKLRVKLSPTFTSGKIKMMFHLMKECSEEMSHYLKDSAKNGECLEWKDVAANYTTDVIGTCAFGIQFNSLKDPNSEFRLIGKMLSASSSWTTMRIIRRIVINVFPSLTALLGVQFPSKAVSDSFLKAVKEIVDYREKHDVKRNDFMKLLIQLKNEGRVEDDDTETIVNEELDRNGHYKKEPYPDDLEMSDDLLAAQVFVFFVGGFETSSTTISFCLQELAMNPDVQYRLQEEIDSILQETDGEVTYEAIQRMKYLDQTISETLRKYPPLGILFRRCTKEYTIPGTTMTVDEGMTVYIPILGLHYDPKYFPDPNRFDPDRFSDENKQNIPKFAYLPFGEGPRICIGMRFGMVQVKLGLVALLRHYEFKVCEKTSIPLRLDPMSFLTSTKDGIWLKITNRPASEY